MRDPLVPKIRIFLVKTDNVTSNRKSIKVTVEKKIWNIKEHNFDTLKRLILLFKQWPDCFIINVQWSGHNNKNTWWIHMKRVMVSDSSSMSRSCSVQRLNQDVYSSSLLFGAQSWSSGTMRFLGYQPESGIFLLNPCLITVPWGVTFREIWDVHFLKAIGM